MLQGFRSNFYFLDFGVLDQLELTAGIVGFMDPHLHGRVVQYEIPALYSVHLKQFGQLSLLLQEALNCESLVAQCWADVRVVELNKVVSTRFLRHRLHEFLLV